MITRQLIDPKSIVVVGGSDNIQSPGGKVLKNLLDGNYTGDLYVINLKQDSVQGIKSYNDPALLPQVDLAIIAIASKFCLSTVKVLAEQKGTKAFIILSAGFSEENKEGAILEKQIVEIIDKNGGCLIGPNCIGFLNKNYNGVFTTPIPELDEKGVDFVSGSGATAVFIMESAIPKGLRFGSVYSVGNSAQIGVEEVVKYWDESFDPDKSSRVKLLYMESIKNPSMLLKHATSLVRKGCSIAAIKSGSSDAGSRAASSHTGAMASPDKAVDALFSKAGIVRCKSRDELATVASVFMHKPLKGNNIAIITHAGGPGVMLTDSLADNGFNIPSITSEKRFELLEKLFPGSSVANPIDFLATGTAEQLGTIIDYCEKEFSEIDGMVVIFGSPGLFPVYEVYEVLHEKMKTCSKPIFPVLPSVINVADEIKTFISKGRIFFPDEVVLGNALVKVKNRPVIQDETVDFQDISKSSIRKIIDRAEDGYLSPDLVSELLDAAGIPRSGEATVQSADQAVDSASKLGYPVVMKVVGPVHKSDVGGVILNVRSEEEVRKNYEKLMKIKDATSVLLQNMLSGVELFAGAKREGDFGHMVLCGLGGIFIEVLKDVQAGLAVLSEGEALEMIHKLKGYGIIKGARKQEPVNEILFAQIVSRLSVLVKLAPEIAEMDLNPLLGRSDAVVAVDARIRIEK